MEIQEEIETGTLMKQKTTRSLNIQKITDLKSRKKAKLSKNTKWLLYLKNQTIQLLQSLKEEEDF